MAQNSCGFCVTTLFFLLLNFGFLGEGTGKRQSWDLIMEVVTCPSLANQSTLSICSL